MKAAKRPKLILVEWEDSAQPLPAWRFLDDLPPMEVIRCYSVGWEVGRANGVLMLAPNIGDAGTEAGQASGFIRIPMSCIKRCVGLRESKA